MAMAAPVAASVGRAAAGKVAQSAAGKGAQSVAGKGAQVAAGGAGGGGKAGAAAAGMAGGGGPKKKGLGDVDLPEKKGGGGAKKGASWGKKQLTTGSSAKYRKALVAEFIICTLLLGLSPLGRPSGDLGPIRFMKRGSATCAFFVILGITSSFGVGAARAAAMFGGLVTLVLAIDQRSAFGKTAELLNARDEDDAAAPSAAVGPSDDTDSPGDVVAT